MVVVSQSGGMGTNTVVTSQPQQPPLVQQPQPPIPPGALIFYAEHFIAKHLFPRFLFASVIR
jgi:hypothetical protein